MIPLRQILLSWLLLASAIMLAARPKLPAMSVADPARTAVEILESSGCDGIKGIWQTPAEGASLAFLPALKWQLESGQPLPDPKLPTQNLLLIVTLDSPSPRIMPGTVMGWILPTAKPNTFDAVIYTKVKGFTPTKPRRFILTLLDDGHISMRAIHRGVVVNPWRFLPYFIRGAFRSRDDSPVDLDGFIRIWPRPLNPASPRYL